MPRHTHSQAREAGESGRKEENGQPEIEKTGKKEMKGEQ